MDNLQWFKFAQGDWMMGKIQRCPEITQARFIRLCCLYWNKEANLSLDDAEIEIDKEHLDILIAKKIIKIDDEHIFIDFLDEQLIDIAETSKGKSKAAKIRWEKHNKRKADALKNDADAMHVHKDAMQNDAEKRREEEKREDKSVLDTQKFLEWFNKRRTQYLEIPSNSNRLTRPTEMHLESLKKAHTNEDFEKAMINLCNDQWANESSQVIPNHLLKPDNFTKYLNKEQKPIITKRQKISRGWKLC